MKLGYEFFAPRILEEMEKNPNVFFQDTLWFKKFQKQIKLYSDTVMTETLDKLLQIPDATIEALNRKFGSSDLDLEQFTSQAVNTQVPSEQSVTTPDGQRYVLRGIPMFIMNVMPNPQGFIERGTQPYQQGQTIQQLPPEGSEIKTVQTQSGLTLSLFDLANWSFNQLNDAMSAISKNNSPYSQVTRDRIKKLWLQQRAGIKNAKPKQRAKDIERFNKVPEPVSNIPPRSTLRKAGQSVKLERNKLINIIAKLARNIKVQQNSSRPNEGLLNNLIFELKKQQRKLKFLLQNYIF